MMTDFCVVGLYGYEDYTPLGVVDDFTTARAMVERAAFWIGADAFEKSMALGYCVTVFRAAAAVETHYYQRPSRANEYWEWIEFVDNPQDGELTWARFLEAAKGSLNAGK